MRLARTDLLFPANLRVALDARGAGDTNVLEAVPGLLETREGLTLYVLARRAALLGHAVEIGSYRGRSTAFLARALDDADSPYRVVAIDPHIEGTEADFRHNVESSGAAPRVDIHVEYSHALVAHVDGPVGLLWIDGDHSYAGVRRDFEDWFPKLAVGGWIAFHDTVDQWLGPTRLVDEILSSRSDLRRVGVVGTLTYAQKTAPSIVNRVAARAARPRIDVVRALRRRHFGPGARNSVAGDP